MNALFMTFVAADGKTTNKINIYLVKNLLSSLYCSFIIVKLLKHNEWLNMIMFDEENILIIETSRIARVSPNPFLSHHQNTVWVITDVEVIWIHYALESFKRILPVNKDKLFKMLVEVSFAEDSMCYYNLCWEQRLIRHLVKCVSFMRNCLAGMERLFASLFML